MRAVEWDVSPPTMVVTTFCQHSMLDYSHYFSPLRPIPHLNLISKNIHPAREMKKGSQDMHLSPNSCWCYMNKMQLNWIKVSSMWLGHWVPWTSPLSGQIVHFHLQTAALLSSTSIQRLIHHSLSELFFYMWQHLWTSVLTIIDEITSQWNTGNPITLIWSPSGCKDSSFLLI